MMKRKLSQLILPLLGAALFILPACQQAPDTAETLEQVAEEPRQQTGELVTVQGRVNRVLGDCAYELEDAELLFPDRLLTLCEPAGPAEEPPTAPDEVVEGDWLRVTGIAGEMTRESYEFKTTLTLDDKVFGKEQTRPVILIETVTKIEQPDPDDDGQARLPEGPVVVPVL